MRIIIRVLLLFITTFISAQNLIYNPGAEIVPLKLNGWTQGCNNALCEWVGGPEVGGPEKDNTYGAGTSTHSGAAHFYPGDNNWTNNDSLYQIVDISAYAAAIDAGTASFTFSAWMSIYRPNNDRTRVAWSFLDASGTTLRYTTSGNIFYTGFSGTSALLTWWQYVSTLTAPVNARKVRVSMFAVYSTGTSADSYYDDLSLTTTATLPVTLINFTGSEKTESILLSWNTTSESNNHFFTIEKSMDGNNWFEIGKVKGIGTTSTLQNYQFNDLNPQAGIQFYRLKQTDIDGLEANYDAISVSYHSEVALLLFPNPSTSSVTLKTNDESPISNIRFINLTGQVVKEMELSGNVHEFNLSDFPAGLYILEYSNEGHISRTTLKKE